MTLTLVEEGHEATLAEFDDRIEKLFPGEALIYHIGDLNYECRGHDSDFELRRIRNRAWELYEKRDVTLVQRRRPDIPMRWGASFEYIAVRRDRKFGGK